MNRLNAAIYTLLAVYLSRVVDSAVTVFLLVIGLPLATLLATVLDRDEEC